MPDRDDPLLALIKKLRSFGVPSLSALIARLENLEEYDEFVLLVKEFLPDYQEVILRESTPAAQIAVFASRFEDRYFPLDDSFKMGDVEGYSDLARGIPVMVEGISYDYYHEIPSSDFRPGFQLMTYLIDEVEEGYRVALAEACEEYVPRELLEQLPEGLTPGKAHRLLDKTPYEALAHWADTIWHDTGNFFLDISWEDLWSESLPDWDRETVEKLTEGWHQAEAINDQICNLAEWLEEEPPARFAELLKFILERR